MHCFQLLLISIFMTVVTEKITHKNINNVGERLEKRDNRKWDTMLDIENIFSVNNSQKNDLSSVLLRNSHQFTKELDDQSSSLLDKKLHTSPNIPPILDFNNKKIMERQVNLNEESELTVFETKNIQKRSQGKNDVTLNTFSNFLYHCIFQNLQTTKCCTSKKYRSFDGFCNNEKNPTWGQKNTSFFRLLPAHYADGIHSLPISVTGAELPNPRSLSMQLLSRENNTESFFTLAVMQWGQTVAHDFAFMGIDQTEAIAIECCTKDGNPLPERLQHHSCAPIIIPSTDKFYSSFRQRCMNFVRSMTVANEECTLDQVNGATSFLDLSPLYGNDEEKSNNLRQFVGGRLNVEVRKERQMMPTTRTKSEFCDVHVSSDFCYKAGDSRTNQNPQLIILHTLLLREHNRIANALSSVNPHWNDEKIFQEARRIFIAVYQHITYHEWLPIVIGSEYCKTHNMMCSKDGLSYFYDPRVNPSTINSFSASAFRFLHSTIEGQIKLFTPNKVVSHTLRLSNHFLRPEVVESGNNFEELLRGLISQKIQRADSCFNTEITEYLFRSRNEFGLDLIAIDIQRGRDHGIPGYNAFRKICHLKPAANFNDLINEISWNNIENLKKFYAHVDDIDLFIGATLEKRLPASLLGPTHRCLISEQFYRSRVGDKYFYDNAESPYPFTPEQYHEIKKASLSRLICDSCNLISKVQTNVFKVQSPKNPLINCQQIPTINFEKWKEQ